MTRLLQFASVLLGAAVVACGDSTAPEDLAGTWEATSVTYTSVADPSTFVDVVDAFGISLTLTLTAGGAATVEITEPGAGTNTETGTYTVNGSNISVTTSGDTSSGTFSISGDTLTVTFTSGPEYDFDGDGTDDPARVVVVATRA